MPATATTTGSGPPWLTSVTHVAAAGGLDVLGQPGHDRLDAGVGEHVVDDGLRAGLVGHGREVPGDAGAGSAHGEGRMPRTAAARERGLDRGIRRLDLLGEQRADRLRRCAGPANGAVALAGHAVGRVGRDERAEVLEAHAEQPAELREESALAEPVDLVDDVGERPGEQVPAALDERR